MSRDHDHLLIPMFHERGIRDEKLHRLNLCRLFLQVLTISDITTGCGTKITKAAWNGVRDMTRTSRYQWPLQGSPNSQDWVLWRACLTKVLSLQSAQRLLLPLGHWLPTEAQCCWFFDLLTERLYQKAGSDTKYYPRAPGRPSRQALMKFDRLLGSPTPGIPASAERATVECTAAFLWLTGNNPSSAAALAATGHTTLQDRLSLLAPGTRWAVTHVLLTDDGSVIAAAIREGRCVSVSDGSFKDQYGTSAWAIEAESSVDRCTGENIPPDPTSQEHRCKGVNIVPGAQTDQSAYRSEVAGLFGIATMIREICAFHDITAGTVYIGCDGLSALKNCTDIGYVVKPISPHFDLIAATRAMLQQCPVKWVPRHVLGHQDNDPDAFLDRWATLNIEMDADAKAHWVDTFGKPRYRQFTISGEPWALWLQDKKICMNLHSNLQTAICGKASLDYWEKRGKFGQGTYSDIDWKATGKAMANVAISRRHWVAKHSSGFCGTSKMMFRWKKRATDRCPRCLHEVEDASHVWKCQDPRALKVWTQAIENLELWMQQQRTHPEIIHIICAKLLAWQSGSTEEIPIGTFHDLPAVVQKQDEIGWQSLLEGRPSLGWSEVQQRYFEWLGSQRSGLRWLTALIQKLWDIAWDMWDNRNRVLHDQENSVARDLQIQKITAEFAKGSAGLAAAAKVLFSRGLQALLHQQPAYQTAWLIRIEAARARAERRSGLRQEHQRDTFNPERFGMRRWLGTTNN